MVILLCFSSADAAAKKEVLNQLAPLLKDPARQMSILCLDDVSPGTHIGIFQEAATAGADVVLLVLSADFLSDSALDILRERLRWHRQERGLLVIPIVWRACAWEQVEWLRGLAPVPRDGTALASLDKPRREQELVAMVQQLADDRRWQLRKKLARTLRDPAELNGFCSNYLPERLTAVHSAPELANKIDRLLATVEPSRLENALAAAFPDRLAQQGATQGSVLCATLRLDRKNQWKKVLAACQKPDNALFILHGQRERAGLSFFVDRLQQFLATSMQDHHRVFLVPFLDREVEARSADGWALRLQTELSARLGSGGNIDQLLARSSARQPFFIILGRQPLGDLDRQQINGLKDFLAQVLPMYLRDKQHVRVLIPYDYPSAKKSAVTEIEAAARKGSAQGLFLFEPLEEASLPPWSDAAEYLHDIGATITRVATLESSYKKLLAGKSTSYFDLATFLNRKLNA